MLICATSVGVYLGHVIFGKGVELEQSQIKVMLDWPIPSNQKDLCGFVGLTDFYRKFINGYASITSPLNSLLCNCTPEAQLAFDNLKRAMTKALVLVLPKFSLPLVLETDAFGLALMQHGHPITFYSKPFAPRMQNTSTYV